MANREDWKHNVASILGAARGIIQRTRHRGRATQGTTHGGRSWDVEVSLSVMVYFYPKDVATQSTGRRGIATVWVLL